jgi:hypothetical protein
MQQTKYLYNTLNKTRITYLHTLLSSCAVHHHLYVSYIPCEGDHILQGLDTADLEVLVGDPQLSCYQGVQVVKAV